MQMWQTVWRRGSKIALFFVSLFLFILAIVLMKDGARALTPLIRDRFAIDSGLNSLGFGWLFAYIIMSGSPVAAAALTFFDAGVIDQFGAFMMVSGSRLGSSFIVLFIGFVYVLRGRNKATSLSMGLLSLLVTATIHVLVLVVGSFLLRMGWLAGWQLESGVVLTALTDYLFDPVVALAARYLPDWGMFAVGLGIILVSFNLFDRTLPQVSLKESSVGRISRVVYRPEVMFLLGALLTLMSMSVSVSLSILVPLSNRGFVRRENVIPYIMGANITTFVDTLLAAVLLQNPAAFTVVLVQMVSVTLAALFLMGVVLRPYQRVVLRLVTWITETDQHLAFFMVIILVLPFVLFIW